MLSQDAKNKGVSESTLITDILNEYYGLSVKASESLTSITTAVLQEIEQYVKTQPPGEFDLNMASATYRGIEMAEFKGQKKTPKTVRASIGRSFASKIGNTPFSNVRKAVFRDKNGNLRQKLSINNAMMYEIF